MPPKSNARWCVSLSLSTPTHLQRFVGEHVEAEAFRSPVDGEQPQAFQSPALFATCHLTLDLPARSLRSWTWIDLSEKVFVQTHTLLQLYDKEKARNLGEGPHNCWENGRVVQRIRNRFPEILGKTEERR